MGNKFIVEMPDNWKPKCEGTHCDYGWGSKTCPTCSEYPMANAKPATEIPIDDTMISNVSINGKPVKLFATEV